MSQENVEVVRATIDAWNAGDMDAFSELHDPEVIVQTGENWPERGPYVGREAVMRGFESIREAFDADSLEPISECIDAADRVVGRFAWRGAGHGPDASIELTYVAAPRKGKIHYVEYFWDHAEALEAAGLSE
jgi:ketosteroid isomerase-like protein